MLVSDSNEIERSSVQEICLATRQSRPTPTLPLCTIFNCILQILCMDCQWKMLSIKTNDKGLPEIHHTRIYQMMRNREVDGSIDRIFSGTIHQLHKDQFLDLSVVHGDGTTRVFRRRGFSGMSGSCSDCADLRRSSASTMQRRITEHLCASRVFQHAISKSLRHP